MRATMMRALAGSGSAHSFLTTAVSTAFSETAADRRQARMGRSRLPRGGQRGPRPGDVERQVGGVLRFLAGRDRLHRIEAQIPTWASKSMSPSSSAVTPRLVIAPRWIRARPSSSASETSSLSNAVPPSRMSRSTSIGRRRLQGLLQVSAQPTSQIREVRSVRRPALRPKHGREQAGDRCETPVLPLIRC